MNFFERQTSARRQSRRLLVLFVLAVLAIVLAVDLLILLAIVLVGSEGSIAPADLWLHLSRPPMPTIALMVAVIVIVVIATASLVRLVGLRAGGSAVARSLGATPVPDAGNDPQHRRLRNVVEEIAIASGVPVPDIHILEGESGINAFASGYSPTDAAVAVTRGALDRLNRDELQGVIAHEFSHILNGDMRLNIQLIGLLHGILALSIIGRRMLEHMRHRRSNRDNGAVIGVAIGLVLIGSIGMFFGRLIKSGISRQREFLADASAVQFTRQTQGIAGALKKIAGLDSGSRLTARGGEDVSHMLFGDGFGLSGMFATHPPLIARIQVLEPGFDLGELQRLRQVWRSSPPSGLDEDAAMALTATSGENHPPRPAGSLPAADELIDWQPQAVVERVGDPITPDFHQARRVLEALPEFLVEAAHSHEQAPGLILALLWSEDAEVGRRQAELLRGSVPSTWFESADRLRAPCAALHPVQRLPVAEIAFPRLRHRPTADIQRLADRVAAMVHADGRISLSEYALATLLRTQVLDVLDPIDATGGGRSKLHDSRPAVLTLLATVAAHGYADPAVAQRAYTAGLARVFPGLHAPYRPPEDWPTALDAGWTPLNRLNAPSKALLIEALAACVDHDGRISLAEVALLRTVSGVLGCPLPPALVEA